MKRIILTLAFITSFPMLAMEKESSNKSLPLLPELKQIIFENLLEDLVKNCANYADYENVIVKINGLRATSQTFRGEINTALCNIKSRLNNAKFNNLHVDYNFALLFLVAKNVDSESINFYFNAQSNINLQNHDGKTALMLAAIRNHKDIVEILISHNADVNLQNNVGTTALLWAASYGHKDIVEILIKHNADINLLDHYGYTALILAAINGHKDIVEILKTEK